jgi:hypothetical protein
MEESRMKTLHLVVVAAVAGGGLVWFLMKQEEKDSPKPSGSPSVERTVSSTPTPSSSRSKPEATHAPTPSPADVAAAELKGNVLVNLGKVDDIGHQAGSMMIAEKELIALRAIDPAARTSEQSKRLLELERQRATTLGALPEIAHFQDNPDEYALFFGALLQQAGNLDAAQTKSVTDYMRARGQAMVDAGLNAAKEPAEADKEEVWEQQRDAFNEDTVDGVARILPPGEAERIGFTDKFIELMEQDFDKAK